MQYRTNHLTILSCVLCVGLLAACVSAVDNRGYIFHDDDIERIDIGTTSRAEINTLLGTPSAIVPTIDNVYYYISSRFETVSFNAPKEVSRRVLAIYFDDKEIVKDFEQYRLYDGKIITISKLKTDTKGRKLSFGEQLFGSLGGGGASPAP